MNTRAGKIISDSIILQKGNRADRQKNNLIRGLREFKSLKKDDEFLQTFQALENNRTTERYIKGNLFPQNPDEIAKKWEIGFSGDVLAEIRWQFRILASCKEALNHILIRKKKLEILILQNQYEDAMKVLDELQENFGVSLWLLENKIFLLQRLGRDAEKEIVDKVRRGMIHTILKFLIMRSSPDMSGRDYDYYVHRELSKFLKLYPDEAAAVGFYRYILCPYAFDFKENLAYVLQFIGKMPLIDRFLCMVDISEYLLNGAEDDALKEGAGEYFFWLKGIDDDTVRTLIFLVSGKEERKSIHVDDSFIGMQNLYLSGRLEECRETALSCLASDVKVVNLYIECSVLLERKITDTGEILLSENLKLILRNLHAVYTMSENYDSAVWELFKLIFCCVHAVWARDLFNYIMRVTKPFGQQDQQTAVKYTNMQRLTLETVCENLPRQEALHYLQSMEEKGIYADFWRRFLEQDYTGAQQLCAVEPLRRLLELEQGRSVESFGILYGDIHKLSPVFLQRYIKLFWRNMITYGNGEAAIDYFLNLFIGKEYYARIAPIARFVESVKEDETDTGNLRIPLLYYVAYNYDVLEEEEDLTIACENFFYANAIDFPSKMTENRNAYPENMLIYFLRYVCTTQNMGPVLLSIRSAGELDRERINICRALRQLDEKNREIYDQEIRDITRKRYINEKLNAMENSKIYVNTEGIKAKIIRNLKSDFNSYMYYRRHQGSYMPPITRIQRNGDQVQELQMDDASQIFREIILNIRDEFVSSGEFGLDGYLSLNIRHGTLGAQLRAPLTKYRLLAPFKVETGTYDVDDRWLYKLKNPIEKEEAQTAIINFSLETEAIIRRLKDELIQVSTEEKQTKGVFQYVFDDAGLNRLWEMLDENSELEDFTECVFEELWRATERNLKSMQETIRGEITEKYGEAFHKLKDCYKKLNKKYDCSENFRWLQETQEQMQGELEKICHWFQRSKAGQYEDFDLEQAFHIGLQMVENIHPEKKFKVRKFKQKTDKKMPGKHLKDYTDIFYNLIANVCEHGKATGNVISFDADVTADETGVNIVMSNDYDFSRGMKQGKRKLDAALQELEDGSYLSAAQKEGGTGILKICKILAVDLNIRPSFTYDYIQENAEFIIRIRGKA